jgi:hypothetical protein
MDGLERHLGKSNGKGGFAGDSTETHKEGVPSDASAVLAVPALLSIATVSRVPSDASAVLAVPALLSIATVSRLLDYSPRTVRRRIADGLLRAVIEGGRVMVRADDLRTYIDGLERVGPAPGRRRTRRSEVRFDWLRD